MKTVEQAKRSAEGSPDNAPSRKRSEFGEITNATLDPQGGKGPKKRQAKSGVIRKESQRQRKPKVAAKANPKQRRSKKKESSVKKPVVIEVEDDSPSGEILGSQDSLEESSASFQDSAIYKQFWIRSGCKHTSKWQ